MLELTDALLDAEVLRILSVQSPGYLIQPDAAAFVADGLDDASAVEASLQRLLAAGHADEREDVKLRYAVEQAKDESGDPVVDESGEPMMVQKLGPDGELTTEPALDDQGNEIIVAAGWEITDQGKAAA